MGQSEVWKRKRAGLADVLRERQTSWLSADCVEDVAGGHADASAAGLTKEHRQWLATRPGASGRSIEE